MKIVDFTHAHIPEATALALASYEEERRHVPALPPIETVPDLTPFANNGFGVAAFEGDKMLGFLCSYPPFDKAFGSTDVRGIFSPMGANGAVKQNRAKIYAAMYQANGAKWVNAEAVAHAVCLYAHDEELQRQFYLYGFGLRCMDAIRPMEVIPCASCEEYKFSELAPNEYRGKGAYQNLLNFTIATLKSEGYTRFGVDFESLNPTAYGFWTKYFTPYTHSVVRRIDENILKIE